MALDESAAALDDQNMETSEPIQYTSEEETSMKHIRSSDASTLIFTAAESAVTLRRLESAVTIADGDATLAVGRTKNSCATLVTESSKPQVMSELDNVLLGQFGDLQVIDEFAEVPLAALPVRLTVQDKKMSVVVKKKGVQIADSADAITDSRESGDGPSNRIRGSIKEKAMGALGNLVANWGEPRGDEQVDNELKSARGKHSCCVRTAENPIFTSIMMVLTFYALFVPDLDMLLGNKGSKFIASIITFVVCLLFVLELVVQSLGRRDYFLRTYFWLDFVAMVSLLPDTWLFNVIWNTNAFVAGRSSRLTRFIRIASRSSKATRLNRLTRIVRVASLMPKIALLFGRKVKDKETEKMLEKKLRRVFTFLDEDMDGLITRSAVDNCLSKMKADHKATTSTSRKVWKQATKTFRRIKANTEGSMDAVSSEKTTGTGDATPSTPSKKGEATAATPSSMASSATASSAGTKDPDSLAPTSPSGKRSARKALTTKSFKAEPEDPSDVSFADFRGIMLGDAWVETRLRKACQAQLKQGPTANLTAKHSEYIAVKVALGVLLLLFVLSMVEPAVEDFSAERGLKHISNLVRLRYGNVTLRDPVDMAVREQVEVWRHGAGLLSQPRRILYLDLEKQAYCNEFAAGGQRCVSSSPLFWGRRVRLKDIDHDILESDFRVDDLAYVSVPDLRDQSISEIELDQRTMSVVVIFVRGDTQDLAVMSLLTTCLVIFIILGGIVLLTKDLTFLSRNLLKPLRELADDMESIAQLQLAGVSEKDDNQLDEGTSEVRLIRRTFENMKKAIKSWGKYVPWPVVQLLLRANIEANLEVTEMEVTIFFSDIASFTTIVESLPPESSLLLLSRYFNDMSKVIDDHGGVVLEFIGDAIQCIYGAPLVNDDHPTSAVKSTLRMLSALRRMNEWSEKRGLPEVAIRCGVHTGRVLVGNMGFNMGFHSRMKYGIVGEDAHIPARLEETNKTYSTPMLISHSTYSQLSDDSFITRPIDYIHLRHTPGASSECIYEVMDRDKRQSKNHPLYHLAKLHTQALEEYRNRDFKAAAQHFAEVAKMKKASSESDQADAASELMLKRCEAYIDLPPPESWDGVWDRGA